MNSFDVQLCLGASTQGWVCLNAESFTLFSWHLNCAGASESAQVVHRKLLLNGRTSATPREHGSISANRSTPERAHGHFGQEN